MTTAEATETGGDPETVLEADGLRMSYGDHDVLRDVTFRARRGEVLALLGPNGAGKTTTIEILEGFRARSAGRAVVLGTDPERGGERWRARVGVVLQSWRDHGKWRVGELLDHLGAYYARYGTASRPRPWDTEGLIEAVGLTGHTGREVRTLSGGQRRRLDVAIGIVGRPEVLFLDEPTAGLDPRARHEFHDLVGSLAADGATTVLLTTHDLAEADRLADRVVILAGGRIVADGTAAGLARSLDEVRWSRAGRRFTRSVPDSTAFVRELLARHDDIAELEVRRATLEDTYLRLVAEAGSSAGAAPGSEAGR
ncbi:ABC transporter ATP-binding protein [Streptomyces sp. JNUCC 64]